MRHGTYGHASFDGQSPQDQNIIKTEASTKKANFLRKKIIIKSMIGHSLLMYKIRGKTKIDIDATSIED
jgi:hypothetical protein